MVSVERAAVSRKSWASCQTIIPSENVKCPEADNGCSRTGRVYVCMYVGICEQASCTTTGQSLF